MNKIEELNKLKDLLDKELITREEFNEMKKEIISDETETIIEKSNSDKGYITVSFAGKWFLFDAKVKILVDDKLHSKHSIKKGFSQNIPLVSSKMKLKIVLGGMKSTTFKLDELDLNKSYDLELEYDNTWGKFSDECNFKENG